MAFRVATAAFLVTQYFLCFTHAKIYHRCELAYELRDVHEIPEHQLATWVCIANYESHFNTSAHNPGSGDHGLFQISELYWCSPPGVGFACGLPCAAFKDDDIEDDVICARRIWREHQRFSGNGFTAWVVYDLHCRNQAHVNSFIEGCFDDENLVKKQPPNKPFKYHPYEYPYEPVYAEMHLPTIIVPMETTVPSLIEDQEMILPSSVQPLENLTKIEGEKLVSITPTTPETPKSTLSPTTNTFAQVETSTTSQKPTSPKVVLSSSTLEEKPTSVRSSTPETKTTTSKPSISQKPTKPKQSPSSTLSHKVPSTRKPTTAKPSQSTTKHATERPKTSSYKTSQVPLSASTARLQSFSTKVSSTRIPTTTKPFQHVTEAPKTSLYKTSQVPLSATTARLSSLSTKVSSTRIPTTTKPFHVTEAPKTSSQKVPQLSLSASTAKPSTSRTGKIKTTTLRLPNRYSATRKPVHFLTTSKPTISTSSHHTKVNTKVSSSSTSSPFSYYNKNQTNKSVNLKSRETKGTKFKPFEFKNNEVVYAVVNKPTYSFAISSTGFKFVRTVR